MIGIVARERGKGRFQALDYRGGVTVHNLIHATLWPASAHLHVAKLVAYLNDKNPEFEFKTKVRS